MHGYQFATPRAILHIGWYWTIHHAARHRHIAHPPLTPQMLLPTSTRCAAASQHDALRRRRKEEKRTPEERARSGAKARITAARFTRYRKWNASIIRGGANCVLALLTIAESPLTRGSPLSHRVFHRCRYPTRAEARFAHARGYVTYADTRLKGRAKIHVPYAVQVAARSSTVCRIDRRDLLLPRNIRFNSLAISAWRGHKGRSGGRIFYSSRR